VRYVLIALVLAAGAAYAQETWRWTDKAGKVYYGANPPKGAIDAKKVANRVSTATSVNSGNTAVNTGAPKAAPFQTVVKDSENVRKRKEDSDKSSR